MRGDLKLSKKDYCENKNGALANLGISPCTATIQDGCVLQVDHIDGNRNNNDFENLRTLCANCHTLKSKYSGDTRNRYDTENAKPMFDQLFNVVK